MSLFPFSPIVSYILSPHCVRAGCRTCRQDLDFFSKKGVIDFFLGVTVFDVITELFAYVIMGQKNAAITEPPWTMTYRYLGNTVTIQHY